MKIDRIDSDGIVAH